MLFRAVQKETAPKVATLGAAIKNPAGCEGESSGFLAKYWGCCFSSESTLVLNCEQGQSAPAVRLSNLGKFISRLPAGPTLKGRGRRKLFMSKKFLAVTLPKGYEVIFRRFRKCPKSGRLLDARQYGLKAWRMVVKRQVLH